MTSATDVRGAAALAPLLASRDRLAIGARAIAPLLNRVVFTGRQVAPFLETAAITSGDRASYADDAVVRVISTGAIDRVAVDLQKLGLVRGARTETSDRWTVNSSVTLEFTQVADAEKDPGALWLEYASLLTVAVNLGTELEPLTARITGAPALLALDWATFASGGESPLDSGELEDIVALVAARPEIVRELAASPPDLRSFVASETRRFLAYDGADHVMRCAIRGANRLPGLIAPVAERLRSIAGLV